MNNIYISDIDTIIQNDISDMIKHSANELTTRIKHRAPVLSGKLKANIKVGINNIPSFTDTTTETQHKDIINSFKSGDDINIVSTAPYSYLVEFGSSEQAPVGYVRPALEELSSIVKSFKGKS